MIYSILFFSYVCNMYFCVSNGFLFNFYSKYNRNKFMMSQEEINYWCPITSIDNLAENNFPYKIKISNQDYVIWKRNNDYVVQSNICSHRCAPLSEGYIDKCSGNLRCSYHGWEFDVNGDVVDIPQEPELKKNMLLKNGFKKSRTSIKNYKTSVHGSILWAYLTNNESLVQNLSIYPCDIFDVQDDNFLFVREVPYDYFILLENLFDPAHVPFAHHKLQSSREEAGQILINNITYNDNKLSIMFQDANNTLVPRKGIMNFLFPYYYYLENIDFNTNIMKKLNVFCIPVCEGRSRVIIKYDFDKGHIGYSFIKYIPIWLRHLLTNTFLDSDALILHEQEKYVRRSNSLDNYMSVFNLPSRSDKAIKKYHKFMQEKTGFKHKFSSENSSFYSQELTRKEILDRYYTHTKNCPQCSDALKNCDFLQIIVPSLIIGFNPTHNLGLTFFIAALHFKIINDFKSKFIFQDYIHKNL